MFSRLPRCWSRIPHLRPSVPLATKAPQALSHPRPSSSIFGINQQLRRYHEMSQAFVQRPAPPFTATTVINGSEFKDVSLKDYLGQWVVLLFYPMDFTFVCPTEIIQFNDNLDRFAQLNTTVLGVSTDSHYSHFAWVQQPRKEGGLGPDLKLPLVADRNFNISRKYGVLIEEAGIALRGLFIIDPKGVLRQITINDLPVGRNVEETLRLIQALQFTDEHGEVCPANWQAGGATMKANPSGSKEYFAKVNAGK